MFTASLSLDLLLGDVHALKEKRSVVRPSEAADASHCREVLDTCERLVASRPDVEVLSVHQQLFGPEDDAGSGERGDH